MLFQTRGGLSMKVRRTVEALNRCGVEARLMDTTRERLTDYDVVHVFAGYNGNNRIVEQAKSDGLPVVMSTILNPPYSAWQGRIARLLTRVVGKLTRWQETTTYRHLVSGMSLADHLVVLGTIEHQMLVDAYNLSPDKISIVPNGIGAEFFVADEKEFRDAYPQIPRKFVLHTGLIGKVKNQLGLVRSLADEDIAIVLIGYAGSAAQDYLDQCIQEGRGKVYALGELPHGSLIASACAAAAVVAIPSRHEGMPNAILEALAVDRPVVLTKNHTMDFVLPREVAAQVDADDHAGIRSAVLEFLHSPPLAGAARAVVARMSWDAVALQLSDIYRRIRP
jgi:glycosyltransferase involved in cell wall biosynthesis